jgi:hypothetical protein
MADLLRRVSDSAPSNEEVTRLQSIVGPLQGMAFSDGLKFLSDTVASTKANKEAKPDSTVKQRASEVRQIYAATKLVPQFKVEGFGYWKALTAARQALKERGITASGAPILTPEQKADKAVAREISTQDVRAIMGDVALTAEDKVQRIAALEQQAAAKVAEGGVEKHAERIIKTNGIDYAKRLVTALEHVIASLENDSIGAAEAEKVVKEPQSAAVQPIKAKKAKKVKSLQDLGEATKAA